jgi:photosystem II stability/assembly factor-like uncharacterized protein
MINRKTILLLFLCLSIFYVNAQNWIQNLPEDKSRSELNLNDFKKAFDNYWAPYEIENGYYTENGKVIKAAGWKQFMRWYYQMEGQINKPDGTFPAQTAQQVYQEYLNNNPTQKSALSANWTVIGPSTSDGGYAGIGRINDIAFHPNENDTWWIGAPSGGVWVTTDAGASWTPITDNNGVLGVSDIAIPSDFNSSQTIYIATGDRDAWHNRSIGVLKSTDAGNTWNQTDIQFNLDESEIVSRLLIDPNNDETILAATSAGLFKTTNGGTTWSNQLFNAYFIDLEYKPGDFNTLYGSTTYGEIWVSTDGGANWNLSHNEGHRIELAVSPANPNIVYAVVSNSSNGLLGIYKSTNSGGSFNMVFDGNTSNLLHWDADGSGTGGQAWYDLAIAVSPTNADLLLIGGINTWRSTDGGNNWNLVNHWYGDGGVQAVHADKHMLKYRSNGDLFECNDGGVYFSIDDGTSWEDKTNGMEISQIYKLGISQTVANETIIGLQDCGTKLISNNTWYDVRGGDGMECLIDFSNVDVQYATVYYGDIRRTVNHWNSSVTVTPTAAGDGAWVTPFIFSPTDSETIYGGYSNVWKTTDRGNTWTKISTMNSGSKLRAMAIAPSNDQIIYVSDPNKIWKTNNDGETWTEVTSNLPVSATNITSIAIKSDDPSTVWVTLSAYNNHAVYQSANGGSSWSNISAGLPELPVYTIVQNTQITSSVHLYVGTELGVYLKNGANDWIPYNEGLPNVRTSELEIYYAPNEEDSRLRLATFGRGLWESSLEPDLLNLPLVETAIPTEITVSSATLGGSVLDEGSGSIVERGVVFANTPNPTTDDFKLTDTDTGLGSFSISATGLNSGTTYYTRAYAINNSGTAYGGQEVFTTTCLPLPLPLNEDFEANNFPPDCWTTFLGSNGLGDLNNWESTTDAQSGSKAALIQSENVEGGLAQDWLLMPSVLIESETHLSFYQKQGSLTNFGSSFFIMVSSTSQTSIPEFDILEQWDESDFSTTYTEKTVDLSDYEGQEIFIGFLMENDNGDDWYIDNLKIFDGLQPTPVANVEVIPDCNTGTVRVMSNLEGPQTFFLTDETGIVLDQQTTNDTFYDFIGISDGIYRGKVEKNGQMSELTPATDLTNFLMPSQPSPISGPQEVCAETQQLYSVEDDPNVSLYSWTLPEDWTGSSTNNSISVSTGSESGELKVIASNTCGSGTHQNLFVTVNSIPSQPGIISGNDTPCIGELEEYTVSAQAGVVFNWTFPTGWTGNSTSNSISLTVGSNSGTIGVSAFNECGESLASFLPVYPMDAPEDLGSISGVSQVMENETTTFSVEPLADAHNYVWTLESIWEILGNDSENEVTILFPLNSESGNLSVKAINQCGESSISTKFIEILPVAVVELQAGTFSVYPNPATENVHIEFKETLSEDVSYKLYNLKGQLVYSGQIASGSLQHRINVAEFKVGSYYLELSYNNSNSKFQLVIQ